MGDDFDSELDLGFWRCTYVLAGMNAGISEFSLIKRAIPLKTFPVEPDPKG